MTTGGAGWEPPRMRTLVRTNPEALLDVGRLSSQSSPSAALARGGVDVRGPAGPYTVTTPDPDHSMQVSTKDAA